MPYSKNDIEGRRAWVNSTLILASAVAAHSSWAEFGSVAGGLVASTGSSLAWTNKGSAQPQGSDDDSLPVQQMEAILQAQGNVINGVLQLNIGRTDLQVTGPYEIPFLPSWQIQSQLSFQSLGDDIAIFNGNVCVLPKEVQSVLDTILKTGLVAQGFHQHYYDLSPMVYFIHFRGIGTPLALAQAVAAVIKTTATPLPQTLPSNPTTPLQPNQLANILGGSAEVAADGVVVVSIPRKETIILAGIPVKPQLRVQTAVFFEPLGNGRTAVAPNFALIGSEVDRNFSVMRNEGFLIGCLYNQETDEYPQLFHAHQLAVGDAYDLAMKTRKGLDQTNSAIVS